MNKVTTHIFLEDLNGIVCKRQTNGGVYYDLSKLEHMPMDVRLSLSPNAFDQLVQKAKEASY